MKDFAYKAWPRICGGHDIASDLERTIPNPDEYICSFEDGPFCVAAFEMRRRGYDVTVKVDVSVFVRSVFRDPFAAWKHPKIKLCLGNDRSKVCNIMRSWDHGARAQIAVVLENGQSHTFSAENVNGEVLFYDVVYGFQDLPVHYPLYIDYEKISDYNKDYFDYAKFGRTRICRIDNLEPSFWMQFCCQPFQK